MSQVEYVTGTAFVVAEFRAEENREAHPLYQDHIVELFLNADTRAAARRVSTDFPLVKDLVRIRTRYLDDMLDQQLRAGVRQVVILGAGLDTRAVRKPAAGLAYFEIDDAATLAVKQAAYQRHDIDANVQFIPGNYVTDGLIDLLQDHGFDVDLPAYFIWEGNTMYLPAEANLRILAEIKNRVRRFRLSFDYMAEEVIAKTTGDPGITRLVESFAAMGAPWLSGFRDVRTLATELQLTLVENVKTADLFRKYWLGRPMMSPIFNLYSLCTLAF